MGDEDMVCSICLEDFFEDGYATKIECGHLYHKSCIESWLNNQNSNCPNCRKEISDRNFKKKEYVFTTEQYENARMNLKRIHESPEIQAEITKLIKEWKLNC